MNKRQLCRLGVPEDCVNVCINIIRDGRLRNLVKKSQIKKIIPQILADPESYKVDLLWGDFAISLIQHARLEQEDDRREPVHLSVWGDDIDEATLSQMQLACKLPVAYGAALMPDGHVGYGLSIGGVLATLNDVVPYGVGVDIACRMRLTVIDLDGETLETQLEKYRLALEKGTLFGIGKKWQNNKNHAVMDKNWNVTPITKSVKDLAWEQLGSSGSGNHFVEFGTLKVVSELPTLEKNHTYVALLSHSGSRGPGMKVCQYYTKIAEERLPKRYHKFKKLAWLSMDSHEGQSYWEAMRLMGQYAAANHDIIHRDVIKLIGGCPIFTVENHHNFAFKEYHQNQNMIVHRKGATPAGEGVLGIIPGSMADPGFVVRGKGCPESFDSASHGAGRTMSRKAAKNSFSWKEWKKELNRRGVTLLSGGIDEVPGAYKSINDVMNAQQDLVTIMAMFRPKIVKMSADADARD